MPKFVEHKLAAFEVIVDCGTPAEKRYAVYADGSISGFGDNAIINNRIPVIVNDAIARYKRVAH